MKRTFTLGVMLLVPVWALQRLYELAPSRQGWVIFGAMTALAMALNHRSSPAKGGTN